MLNRRSDAAWFEQRECAMPRFRLARRTHHGLCAGPTSWSSGGI